MKDVPSLSFNSSIFMLIENMELAWNNLDMELMSELLDENVVVHIEPITISKIFIAPEKIIGRHNVIDYVNKLRKKLPLRYVAEFDKDVKTKNIKYRKYFYEVKAWAYFESTISEYGKFKEFKISGYENVHAKKLTTLRIIKNILWFKIKSMIRNKN